MSISKAEIIDMLELTEQADLDALYARAYAVKERYNGRKAHFRGLIELSNICDKDCMYCGIRRSGGVERYIISKDDAVAMARWAYENRYGSVTLQAGERSDARFVEYITDLIKSIKQIGGGALGITLSLGEQTYETYSRWRNAGAHRYLLRIETTNKALFNKIHCGGVSFANRLQCIEHLKHVGFHTGTGVIIGLPHQTVEDIANDILFMEQSGCGMVGMGPYVIAEGTPLGDEAVAMGMNTDAAKKQRFELALKTIAATRIALEDVNIASATALHALDPLGRQKALRAGANILMPVLTLPEYKRRYTLYDGKPGLDDDATSVKHKLVDIVESVGETVGFGEWGDSPRYVLEKRRK